MPVYREEAMYIKIVDKPISPEEVVARAKSLDSGCVVTYVGLIRNTSHGKPVRSVEYRDTDGKAESRLQDLAADIRQKFPVNNLAMCHRTGRLKVGDINLVFAFACGHRQEGFAACAYAIDKFKDTLPTAKTETYEDGTILNASDS
jgi:molybdopterin synthase catalytic subunit